MAGIFTRPELTKIITNVDLTPEERVDQIFSLYGRAVDDGFVTRKASEAAVKAAVDTAKEAWSKEQPTINVKESEEYKALQADFDGYKSRQTARTSDDFKEVKPKFFDRVYDLIDRADGAKPVNEQIAAINLIFISVHFTAQNICTSPKNAQKVFTVFVCRHYGFLLFSVHSCSGTA